MTAPASGKRILHGLLQKAKLDAERLKDRLTINHNGQIWRRNDGFGWYRAGDLPDPLDAEDFLLAQLTQEDR